MRKLSLLVVFAAITMAVGCGGDLQEQHTMLRSPDAVGEQVQGESRSFSVDSQGISVEGQVQASAAAETDASLVDSCSGSCNATVCVCYGTYDCCRAGCSACFEVAN
ncbi:hypothetical protein [Pyxidicoccus sp. MSG2]|uniref:hypothetical protein n=1 Tax=Pyxidicoccus sp. MSG2 TaxID=2996790 RepID=UPI00226DDD87|nr:hypothetical protein [Pyxidicoccus sp. MSG2]MCY1022705.1 hypothetical protein [Pyxidicoccus sp. MSG2]